MVHRPARVVYDNLSVSLLNQGYGTSACITIRRIDNEGHVGLNLDQHAQLGILGRIITSVRIRLLESVLSKGITDTTVIHEHPSEICGLLINLVDNFSMNTLGTLSAWMTLLNREVNELTVTKHFAHSEKMRDLYELLLEFKNSKYSLLSRLHAELIAANLKLNDSTGMAEAPEERASPHCTVYNKVLRMHIYYILRNHD